MTAAIQQAETEIAADVKTVLRQFWSEVEKRFDLYEKRMEDRFQHIDERFRQVDERFRQVDERFRQIEDRFTRFDEGIEKRFATKADLAALESRMGETKADLIRWMFVFWIGQVAVMVGILKMLK